MKYPIEITLKIQSEEELHILWNRLNVGNSAFDKYIEHRNNRRLLEDEIKIKPVVSPSYSLWSQVHDVVEKNKAEERENQKKAELFIESLPDRFVKFMKNAGAWGYYKKNVLANSSNRCLHGPIDLYDFQFICNAFDWENTEEGHDYWSEIHKSHKELLAGK